MLDAVRHATLQLAAANDYPALALGATATSPATVVSAGASGWQAFVRTAHADQLRVARELLYQRVSHDPSEPASPPP